MRLRLRKPAQALNKAYAKQSIAQERMDAFRGALARLFSRVDENESEEHQKTIVAEFLHDAFYAAEHFALSLQGPIDLVIQPIPDNQASASQATPAVLIETRKVFAGEMMTTLKNNVRALHELILYYFEERDRQPDVAISQLIVTDVYNWFLFDESDFQAIFYDNTKLKKLFNLKQQQKKDNTFFYSETARILRDLDEEIPVTCLNLREMADALKLPTQPGNQVLIPAFKLLSPEHLLKVPFTNDASLLNQRFFQELLHLIGLRETTAKRSSARSQGAIPQIQRLPEGERLDASLLEGTIRQLQASNALASVENPEQYGQTEAAQLVNVGLTLSLTWLYRLLFFKLAASQLAQYNHLPNSSDNQTKSLLTVGSIQSFHDLDDLLVKVIGVPVSQRSDALAHRFKAVPYLPCPLFELTDLERSTIQLNTLDNSTMLPVFDQTILPEAVSNVQPGQLSTLHYLLTFVDSYDFLADGTAEVRSSDKPLINASGVGLVLEKLSSYGGDSSLTPGFITTYLVSNAIRRAVLTRFNEHAITSECLDTIDELATVLGQFNKPDDLFRINAIFNSLRLVDPVVGSGQFLVSALNELIALKAELGILCDRSGQPLRHYSISVIEHELVVTNDDNQPFQYYAPAALNGGSLYSFSSSSPAELQRVQETLFYEKQRLIENCLFGIDNKPYAVDSGRLRLWIELLKSLYYVAEGERQGVWSRGPGSTDSALSDAPRYATSSPTTGPASHSLPPFPNLDLTIKVGNPLIGRLDLGFRIDSLRNPGLRDRFVSSFTQYSADVLAYKHSYDQTERDHLRARIQAFGQFVDQIALVDQKDYAKIRQLEAKLAQSALPFDLAGTNDRQRNQSDVLAAKKAAFADRQRLFQPAFEWRFAFPETLDETGNYVGFDVVVSHPPITRLSGGPNALSYFRNAFPNTYTRSAPLYALFVEQGVNLLRPNGELAFLLPNKWLQASDATKLRHWLKTKAIEQITELGDESGSGVFQPDNCILMVRHADTTGTFRAVHIDPASPTTPFFRHTVDVLVSSLQDSGWVYTR